MSFLENIKDEQEKVQSRIADKIKNNMELTDEEITLYTLNDEDMKMLEIFKDVMDGNSVSGFTLNDFLATPQAKVLIPRVIVGAMRKAADPLYLASAFFKKIRLKSGQAVMFPSIGVMSAHDVAEGQEIPQETIDWQLHTSNLITVGKSGIRIQFTDEILKDVEFDIVGMMLAEAGRAMARHKEQKAFNEFISHGHVVFDNELRDKFPEAGTTGVDYANNFNNTLSVEDLLDLIIAVYNNEYTPTDLIIHPLAWSAFAKNGLTGSLTAPFEREAKRELPTAGFKLGPDSIQGRLPFAFNVNLSPFAPIDKVGKTFDIICVDRNNVGVEIVKEDMKTESFRDPSRDINNTKVIERYGFGTYNEGRAVCTARAISMAKSYPTPERVQVLGNVTTTTK